MDKLVREAADRAIKFIKKFPGIDCDTEELLKWINMIPNYEKDLQTVIDALDEKETIDFKEDFLECTAQINFGNGHQSKSQCLLKQDGHKIHKADGYGWAPSLYWKDREDGKISCAGYSGEGLVDEDEYYRDQLDLTRKDSSHDI